ncbi:hypothetical protein VE03_04868 [Pseudogymnoascus sp. 23342-1-I1]|nr:hypothetical protein VE03_04868 [Pseudogymnoascus sp. 23342-1-I1]
MSNLTVLPTLTSAPTLLPTYTFTNSSISSSTSVRTTTDANGDVETITDITVVQPTGDAAGTSDSSPATPTESGSAAGVRVGGERWGLGGWIVALLAVGVGMGFM